MQLNQADVNSCNRVGVDEHLIKFKSSPNFKNMKKFIKSRSETTIGGNKSTIMGAPNHSPKLTVGKMENHIVHSDWPNAEVQPPLPLDPPPPDDIIPNVQVKQEVIDTEYEATQSNKSPRLENTESSDHTEHPNDNQSKICRDFIRGTCKREGTCKYAHKYDLTQLEGVYTFCRKFQNSVCTFTNCKYVHATIFEEQHFYRTGMLPAHALQHRTNMLQPPPPPPPEEPPFVPFKVDFSNPPPPLPIPNEMEKPMVNCVPTSSMEPRHYMPDLRNQMPPRSRSPLKREWSNLESFAAPPCDLAYNEQLPKKCKHCDIMEFRLDHNKNKVKKMLQSKEQLSKKMALLEKQSEKLRSLISELLKPTISSRVQTHSNAFMGDKDKTLLEQLNSFLSVNSRLSTLGEDK